MTESKSLKEPTDYAFEHLHEIKQDIRDEIKQRIKQRDQYSIQLTIALSALVAVASTASFTGNASQNSILDFSYRVLLAAPLVSIYFTTLILYSYRIHEILAKYLRDKIEPELARLCTIPPEMEWEAYYSENALPGIRKVFFIGTLWVICLTSLVFVGIVEKWQGNFMILFWLLTVIYIGASFWITKHFWRE